MLHFISLLSLIISAKLNNIKIEPFITKLDWCRYVIKMWKIRNGDWGRLFAYKASLLECFNIYRTYIYITVHNTYFYDKFYIDVKI